MSTKSKRQRIFINGYEYWFETSQDLNSIKDNRFALLHSDIIIYDSETDKIGIPIECCKWTNQEEDQLFDYFKYRWGKE